jgi:Raf kinase inhibitor-like YbhB/YbcL family protein
MTSKDGFTLSSPAFADGAAIPRRFTCDGDDIAPHLVWSGVPEGTRSFALIVDDPDAPRGTFTHWVVFDIPADRGDLPGGARAGGIGVWGRNSRGDADYMGPCPPSGTHRYIFRLAALDVETLGLMAGASRQDVEHAIAGHTLATARLVGRYHRS